MIPKFISETIDDFKFVEILTWIKELGYFFILPKKFFDSLYKKNYKTQVLQTFFYIVMSAFLISIIFNTIALLDVYKSTLTFFTLALPFVLINVASTFIINRSRFDLWKVVSFTFIVWSLYSIPICFTTKIFATSENYSFYFISSALFVVCFLHSTFFICHILYDNFYSILSGYILNIVLLNIAHLTISLLMIDTYSSRFSIDPIIEELHNSISKVGTFDGQPYTYIEEYNDKTGFKNYRLGLIRNDTVFYYDKSSVNAYKNMAKKNAIFLDSMSQKVYFKRNKEILILLSDHFQSMSNYFSNPKCDTCLIEHVVLLNSKDSSIFVNRKEYIVDQPYIVTFTNARSKIDRIVALNEFAMSPFYIPTLIITQPITYIASIFGFEEENINVNIEFL